MVNSLSGSSANSTSERTVRLWMANQTGQIDDIRLIVTRVGVDLDAVQWDSCTVGFVLRAEQIFVALVGSRHDRAEECGQFFLWGQAAARVLALSDHAESGLTDCQHATAR